MTAGEEHVGRVSGFDSMAGTFAVVALGAAVLLLLFGLDVPTLLVYAIGAASLAALPRASARDSERVLPVSTRHAVWAAGCVVAFLVYHFRDPGNSFIPIFDHLDGVLPIYRLLAQGPVFDGLDVQVPELLGGVPKNSLYTQLDFYVSLFRVLPPAQAFVVHDAAQRAVGLIGMALLLRRWLPALSDLSISGAAVAFALLPHLAAGSMSVAGLPLLAWAFLKLRAGNAGLGCWAVVALFPFASIGSLVSWWLTPACGVFVLIDWLRTRRLPVAGVAAVGLLAVGFLVSDYRLLYQLVFDTSYVSHRADFGPTIWFSASLPGLVVSSLRNFIRGYTHAPSLQWPVVIGAVALAGGLIGRRFTQGSASAADLDLAWWLVGILLVNGALSFVFGLSFHLPFENFLLSSDLGLFKTLQLTRVVWCEPVLWFAAFALALEGLARWPRWGRVLAISAASLQLARVFFTGDIYEPRSAVEVRFDEYFSEELFQEIQRTIDRPLDSYRVASLGMSPSIALYNGFYTADGYVGNYPLEYKRRFRALIAHELDKNEMVRRRFDLWGSKCLVLSDELARRGLGIRVPGFTRDKELRSIRSLELEPSALAELGIDYLLSAVEIENYHANGLRPRGVFEHPRSPWQIFLYARAVGDEPERENLGMDGRE